MKRFHSIASILATLGGTILLLLAGIAYAADHPDADRPDAPVVESEVEVAATDVDNGRPEGATPQAVPVEASVPTEVALDDGRAADARPAAITEAPSPPPLDDGR